MSEQNKKIIAGLHRKDLTNIKFASALLDMAIEEKKSTEIPLVVASERGGGQTGGFYSPGLRTDIKTRGN